MMIFWMETLRKTPRGLSAAGATSSKKDGGVRNALDTTKTASNKVDPGVELLASILGKALGGKTTTSSSGNGSKTNPTRIYTDTAITNAFSIVLAVSSWVDKGQLVIGPYQGVQRNAGYRIVYNIGGSIDLLATSNNGTRVIATAKGPFALEDKKVHAIEWNRDNAGNMQITLDETQLFELHDVSFRDPFSGFGMATNGGDFIVKSIDVFSTP